jgi:hypothetical protein
MVHRSVAFVLAIAQRLGTRSSWRDRLGVVGRWDLVDVYYGTVYAEMRLGFNVLSPDARCLMLTVAYQGPFYGFVRAVF